MTTFFVPGADPDEAEARYRALAEAAGVEPARPADRVATLRFARGAEEWTAIVGERLSGQLAARTERRSARRGPTVRTAPSRRVDDPVTVLAIVEEPEALTVITDGRPVGEIDDSTWPNPFRVPRHEVRGVARFDG